MSSTLMETFKAQLAKMSFKDIKQNLTVEVKNYQIEVTDENLALSRSLATTLNKASTELKSFYNKKDADLKKELSESKDEMNALNDIIQGARETIKVQLDKYTELKLEAVKKALVAYRADAIADAFTVHGIQLDENTIIIEHLIKIGSCNFKGFEVNSISAKITKEIDELIQAQINQIEAIKREAKLKAMEEAEGKRLQEDQIKKKLEEKHQRDLEIQAEKAEKAKRDEADRVERDRLKAIADSEREKQEAIERAKREESERLAQIAENDRLLKERDSQEAHDKVRADSVKEYSPTSIDSDLEEDADLKNHTITFSFKTPNDTPKKAVLKYVQEHWIDFNYIDGMEVN